MIPIFFESVLQLGISAHITATSSLLNIQHPRRFHTSYGAKVLGLVPGYRPEVVGEMDEGVVGWLFFFLELQGSIFLNSMSFI